MDEELSEFPKNITERLNKLLRSKPDDPETDSFISMAQKSCIYFVNTIDDYRHTASQKEIAKRLQKIQKQSSALLKELNQIEYRPSNAFCYKDDEVMKDKLYMAAARKEMMGFKEGVLSDTANSLSALVEVCDFALNGQPKAREDDREEKKKKRFEDLIILDYFFSYRHLPALYEEGAFGNVLLVLYPLVGFDDLANIKDRLPKVIARAEIEMTESGFPKSYLRPVSRRRHPNGKAILSKK